ncbi:hypothetical protein [Kitasatospora sp. NPDC057015]|uniref:hypothetical protein n=1 Tax=Kitasatospora sp. NPDC057015 TaxID=3346001 RepID=UPI0036290619
MHPTGPVARRFPLVARIRPACLPLDARVGRLRELADTAAHRQDPGLASTVFNQAALLASDLGLPNYARSLCHRHARLYLDCGPLPAMSAIRGLEPIVNLARLHIRAGQHQRGHQLLLNLYEAVTTTTEATLDGITVPARLTETAQQRGEVRAWLWRVVIADGTRALTAAGRWTEALRHIEEHRGFGLRMLDGRQVAVFAAATAGDLPGALVLLKETAPGDPWENAVTAVLTALCSPGDQHAAEAGIDECLALHCGEGLTVFSTRLSLSALDAADPDMPAARNLFDLLTSRTGDSGDGYALRDFLSHSGIHSRLAPGRAIALERALAACALNSATLPGVLQSRFEDALSRARTVLENSPFDPGKPEGDSLEQRTRTAPSSVITSHNSPS